MNRRTGSCLLRAFVPSWYKIAVFPPHKPRQSRQSAETTLIKEPTQTTPTSRTQQGEPTMIKGEADVTPAVLAVMERTKNPRLREIMLSLVAHLHSFVRDVGLTEAEFREAAAILNEIGHLTTDTHNE